MTTPRRGTAFERGNGMAADPMFGEGEHNDGRPQAATNRANSDKNGTEGEHQDKGQHEKKTRW
ncbi:hypothetical protein [Streptomyces sp. SID3343]|uniref:hypothetical protein n=1 Tax=Streptomyces sp. SID3343 TaxID=2690260 RepID=UPI00192798AA|nr:hypothetical protein [Streptomyces sp. SID3343]